MAPGMNNNNNNNPHILMPLHWPPTPRPRLRHNAGRQQQQQPQQPHHNQQQLPHGGGGGGGPVHGGFLEVEPLVHGANRLMLEWPEEDEAERGEKKTSFLRS